MSNQWKAGQTFLLITGASRGLGKAFSIAMARQLSGGDVMYLTARSEEALLITKSDVMMKNDSLRVESFVIDQEKAEKQIYVNMMKNIDPNNFKSAVIIHNAGSIGKQGQSVSDYDEREELCSYYNLNLISVAVLNSVFMKTFAHGRNQKTLIKMQFKCMGVYKSILNVV